ncbi:hypothetical protein MRB53_010799 [Persea americana]|uniref:Uncharacterized protein n=1 Tax=Persea americana TaxID=3435 RepID=A0ACC2LT09_PERAE|nr:hypothetical protein MRB53_010799 [Persea americana]
MEYLSMLSVVLQLLMLSILWKLCSFLVWRPYTLTKWFAKQGIRGPTYSLVSGCLEEIKSLRRDAKEIVMDTDSNDIIPRVQPHYHKWLSLYGDTFLYWYGTEPRVFISEPEQAKEVLSNKFGFYPKPKAKPTIAAMMGKGLVFVEGPDWVRHRRAVSPAFNIDKLKVITKRMAACTLSMLNGWQEKVTEAKGQCVEMEMGMEFKQLTADIISHTTFGTSFIEGKEVFEVQMELQERAIVSSTDIFIPGTQYLPTKWNIRTWILKRRLRNTLKNIIVSRLKSKGDGGSDTSYGDDLLGLMMGLSTTESSNKQEVGLELNVNEIMDECKTFFFAGHETTSHLLTWTMFLLSINKEWQEKVREEVLRECGMGIPDADKLSKLKLLNMVLLEALRLYTPVIVLLRKASKEMKLGNLTVPKDTQISIPLSIIHRNKKYWGEDANEFNPMRFAEGVKKAAKHPNALIAFSIGPRACIGQNFAIMEGKTVMALILQRFSFSLSPKYKHAPADRLTLQPQYGLPILLKPLQV